VRYGSKPLEFAKGKNAIELASEAEVVSRVLECISPKLFFNLGDHLIVLGDVPLRTSTKQLLLVHQPDLQDPKVNRFVAKSAVFRGMRAIARFNSPLVDCVIV
jgi:hypothetical protein